ncbi:MAG TPA: TetR/AcrR family transcriptional regulator [Candidatus Limnocylindrales bacterium]|nr:TetR/AcrR family transcriptional regulator [Candidatus Limnocylindrales bacterium]
MRVTAETRAATRERILEASRQLFAENGFEIATTRDIAYKAEIGVGTLFNYFPAKEVIVATLAADAIAEMLQEFGQKGTPADSLEEELFAFVAAGLRKLKPFRKQIPIILETALSPLAGDGNGENYTLRVLHLETVIQLVRRHDVAELSPVALQMYWSLYTGLLSFWAGDKSPRQEDTLALLDHSTEMFVGWLRDHTAAPTNRSKPK